MVQVHSLNKVIHHVKQTESENPGRIFEVKQLENTYIGRSSHPEVFLEKGALNICSKFTGEHPYRSVISIKLQSKTRESFLMFPCRTYPIAWWTNKKKKVPESYKTVKSLRVCKELLYAPSFAVDISQNHNNGQFITSEKLKDESWL